MPARDPAIMSLIDALYAAAAGDESWELLAPLFADAFSAQSCALQLRSRNGHVLRLSQTANYTPQLNQTYVERLYGADPWVKAGLRKLAATADQQRGIVATSDELISDRDLVATEFYNEFLRILGVFYILGAGISLGESGTVCFLGLHRARAAARFCHEEQKRLAVVLPHLGRALRMRSLLDGASIRNSLALDALDALGVGMFVVGPDCRIVFSNGAAESMMAEGGGAICCRNGRLGLTTDKRSDFEQLVRTTATHFCRSGSSREDPLASASEREEYNRANPGALITRDAFGRMVSLVVCPLEADRLGLQPSGPSAVVFVEKPGDKPSRERALAQLYRLTPAERRLTTALLDGERANDYADRAGITRNTVKTQLSQIFAKTGVSRQSDLVRMISGHSSVAIFEHELGRSDLPAQRKQ